MRFLFIPLAVSLLTLGAGHALAQAPAAEAAASDSHPSDPPATPSARQQAPLSEGEITRWDPRTLRVTLKHGEIKNLEMPPMTMVFRVADASVLGDLKPGDKVRFRAEQVNGTYHVTRIEKSP